MPARPGPRPRASADDLAAPRRLAVDDVRHRRPAQGRRRRGRRARVRSRRDPARQPARDADVRRSARPADAGDRRSPGPARAAPCRAQRRRRLGRRAGHRRSGAGPARRPRRRRLRCARVAAAAPRGGLVVLVSDFRGARDWSTAARGGRRAPPGPRGRDPRPARGRPARRRRAHPDRRRDGPRGPRRHVVADAPRAVRRGRRSRARARSLASSDGSASATSSCPPPAAGCGRSPVSSAPLGSHHDLRLTRAPRSGSSSSRSRWSGTCSSSAGGRATPSGSRTWTCSSNLVPRRAAWRRHVPTALYLARRRRPGDRARPAVDGRGGPARRGDDHPDHGRVGLDAGDRRRPEPPRGGQEGRLRLRRPAAGAVQGRARRVLDEPPASSWHRRPTGPPIHQAIDGLQADGGTALGDAIALSLEAAGRRHAGAPAPASGAAPAPSASTGPVSSGIGCRPGPDGPPLVATVLLSDGANSTGSLEPQEAADQAAAAGVPVYTIALGTADRGRRRPGSDRAPSTRSTSRPDPETLAAIAETTGGRFFEAPTVERPGPDLREPRLEGRDDRRRTRRSPSGSPRPGSSWSWAVRASRPSGSTGSREPVTIPKDSAVETPRRSRGCQIGGSSVRPGGRGAGHLLWGPLSPDCGDLGHGLTRPPITTIPSNLKGIR